MKVITRNSPLPTETKELSSGSWTSLDCNLWQTTRGGLAEALQSIFVAALKNRAQVGKAKIYQRACWHAAVAFGTEIGR
jgi:hypothetical protein